MSQVQSYIRKNRVAGESRLDLFKQMAGKSKREVEEVLEPDKKVNASRATSPAKSFDTKSSGVESGGVDASPPRTRYIPARVRREVWQKSEKRCAFIDPATGKTCDSRHALQIDHIEPYALGGANDANNLQLLCRQHNLWRAARSLGVT